MQEERESEGKKKIANWKVMVSKIKETYLPKDYEVQLHKKRHNLKQKDLDVATFTEEFQKLSLRSRVQETGSIRVAMYHNDLKWAIQDELMLFSLTTLNNYF